MSPLGMPEGVLKLADGTVYRGRLAVEAGAPAAGEVVFCTAMGGYPEAITDPSYADQILVLTFPQVGIYGVPPAHLQASRPRIRALVVRELAPPPPGELGLGDYLAGFGVPVLTEVDTRQLVRHLRRQGTVNGVVAGSGPTPDLPFPRPDALHLDEPHGPPEGTGPGPRVTVVDLGVKRALVRLLRQAGAQVRVVGPLSSAQAILEGSDGVVFSNGPGDPVDLAPILGTVRRVAESRPTLGICLGHQALAEAFGGRTYKLRFGHRGANHPVQDLATGAVWTTSHNHGYAVDEDLPQDLEPTALDLTDRTLEGLRHRHLPVLAVQFHPEGAPGPSEALLPVQRFLSLLPGGEGPHER
jgi:carbamoyl-phosphate synthase small subunit